MRLHLIRHPKPSIEPGICYGQLDILAKIETAELACLRAELPPGLPVWSSPLQRCRQLAEQLHPQPIIDARLAEMSFGDWEGRPWDDIPRHELDAWAADVAGYAPPGGESPRALQLRALDFVASLTVPEAVIVTHAGVIRTLLAHWLELDDSEWLSVSPDYLSVTTVERDANGRVLSVTNR
ncbi:MAG: alpha-ribazole phosphatase family protein [Betaproteobacteria bacterium]|nr:alpha-ribazole phosphatase family protein [Betaproteobacteria bacterium]